MRIAILAALALGAAPAFAQVNLGKFTQGQAAYLFVVDASGTVSATGLALTAGGTTVMPNPPSQFTVQ